MNKVYVIGIGFRPLDGKAAASLLGAEVVLTNRRLLEVFMGYAEYDRVRDRIIVHGSVYEMLDYIANNYREKKLALLAAGDPMFFGIGRMVTERLGRDAVEVYPDLSSVQVAFSRIGETSNNALLISLHGGPDPSKRRAPEYEIDDVPRLLTKYNKIAALTDKVNNPVEIAKAILSSLITCHSSLVMYVCERLGYPDEKIIRGTPEEIAAMSFAEPNVVVIVKKAGSGEGWKAGSGEGGPNSSLHPSIPHAPIFGLREDEIQHSRGLITKDEVRAVAIHKLRLPERGVLWDIGAGSGSLSIEAARLCPELRVFAVEKDEQQLSNINENQKRFNITNIETTAGEAPDVLKDIPSPDRVFIGGSGGRMDAVLALISGRMETGAVVINATTIETLNEAVQGLEKNGYAVEISEVSVSRSKVIAGKRHMSALNPVFIITGARGKGQGSGILPLPRDP
ncbi:MAG: precorrin-6y C5,15-methyltransferase (decarboxylating) subunit CbiE [Nitrospirae bacterium]|nr:precorrin-6y C5,15-methyltransferase (decarboxylating) subunit CbiE [Nitrospirota bacterium]